MQNIGKFNKAATLADLLKKIEKILTTEDVNIKGLSDAAGLDPARDFRGIYLNGLPLTDEDVRGFDFSGSDLRNTGVERAKRDRTTVFENAIFDGPSLDLHVISFNKKLRNLSSAEVEAELDKAINKGGRKYDVISFTTAIRRAPNSHRAEHWYDEMKKAGVAPDDVTFNTLISKAATPDRAEHWYDEMKKAGVVPDDVTFSTLISKAATPDRAEHWYDEMKKAGVTTFPV